MSLKEASGGSPGEGNKMKITLLNAHSKKNYCSNKDVMGGFGLVTKIGNSPLVKLIEVAKKKGVKLPIIDFAYLAAILARNGHDVEYKENTIPDADLVIIHSSIVDYKTELNYARLIKNRTKAKIGFIGPFASFRPEIYEDVADFIIKGEPESIAMSITDRNIPQGIVQSMPLENLDELPWPKWDIFPIERYSYYPVIRKKPFLPILSSRGCCFYCNYCPYKAYYGEWRRRSVDNIIDEIKNIIKKYKVKGLLFRDPLFTFDKKRASEIAERIIKERVKIEWACETHFDFLDEDLIDLLYESGLRSINVGIESSDETVMQKATRKYSKKEHQEKLVDYCDKKGIKIAAFYIIGLPDDTEASIRETIKYAKKLNTHVAQFFIMTPFPGTEFYEQVKGQIYVSDYEQFNSFTPVFRHKNLTEKQLLKLKEKAFLQYYFRPKYIFKFLRRML